jgi:hypothetical protein
METVAVRSELELTLVSAEIPVILPAALEYQAADPYAVSLVVFAGGDEVRWSFARDLLDEGLVHEVGDGDVQVVPPSGQLPQDAVQIRLESPAGIAILEAPVDGVLDFLARTYTRVPSGAESQHLDLDGAITKLLTG